VSITPLKDSLQIAACGLALKTNFAILKFHFFIYSVEFRAALRMVLATPMGISVRFVSKGSTGLTGVAPSYKTVRVKREKG
jgi:hypothetical protein